MANKKTDRSFVDALDYEIKAIQTEAARPVQYKGKSIKKNKEAENRYSKARKSLSEYEEAEGMTPGQPTFFTGGESGRFEDSGVGQSWKKFTNGVASTILEVLDARSKPIQAALPEVGEGIQTGRELLSDVARSDEKRAQEIELGGGGNFATGRNIAAPAIAGVATSGLNLFKLKELSAGSGLLSKLMTSGQNIVRTAGNAAAQQFGLSMVQEPTLDASRPSEDVLADKANRSAGDAALAGSLAGGLSAAGTSISGFRDLYKSVKGNSDKIPAQVKDGLVKWIMENTDDPELLIKQLESGEDLFPVKFEVKPNDTAQTLADRYPTLFKVKAAKYMDDEQARNLVSGLSGMKKTSAQMAENPALAKMQESLGQSDQYQLKTLSQLQKQNQAASGFFDAAKKPTKQMESAGTIAARRGSELSQKYGLSEANPDTVKSLAGKKLFDKFAEKANLAKSEKNAAYDAFKNQKIKLDNFESKILGDKTLSDISKQELINDPVFKKISGYIESDANMTVGDVGELKNMLQDAINTAKSSGKGAEVSRLVRAKSMLDESVDEALDQFKGWKDIAPQREAAANKYNEFASQFKPKYNATTKQLESDTASQLFDELESGQSSQNAEKFLDRFIRIDSNKAGEGISSLRRLFKGNEAELDDAVSDYLLADLQKSMSKSLGKEKNLEGMLMSKDFKNKYSQVLKEFPKAQKDIDQFLNEIGTASSADIVTKYVAGKANKTEFDSFLKEFPDLKGSPETDEAVLNAIRGEVLEPFKEGSGEAMNAMKLKKLLGNERIKDVLSPQAAKDLEDISNWLVDVNTVSKRAIAAKGSSPTNQLTNSTKSLWRNAVKLASIKAGFGIEAFLSGMQNLEKRSLDFIESSTLKAADELNSDPKLLAAEIRKQLDIATNGLPPEKVGAFKQMLRVYVDTSKPGNLLRGAISGFISGESNETGDVNVKRDRVMQMLEESAKSKPKAPRKTFEQFLDEDTTPESAPSFEQMLDNEIETNTKPTRKTFEQFLDEDETGS